MNNGIATRCKQMMDRITLTLDAFDNDNSEVLDEISSKLLPDVYDLLLLISMGQTEAAPAAPAPIHVSVGCMKESNGRETWMVMLAPSQETKLTEAFQVYSSASEGRARYTAADLLHRMGLGPMPDPTAFDTELPAAPAAPAEPVPAVLVRDLAEILATDVPTICKALLAIGGHPRSTNMAVGGEEAVAVAKALAEPAAPAEPVVAQTPIAARKVAALIEQGWKPVGYVMDKDGERTAITVDAAVAWLTAQEVYRLMFIDGRVVELPADAPAAPARAEAKPAPAEPVPEGWKLVPVEPTIDQEVAGRDAQRFHSSLGDACRVYKAMLAAAPAAPAEPVAWLPSEKTVWRLIEAAQEAEGLDESVTLNAAMKRAVDSALELVADALEAEAPVPEADFGNITKDAERYRWLRLQAYATPRDAIPRFHDLTFGLGATVPDMLDAAIDAAIAASKKGGAA